MKKKEYIQVRSQDRVDLITVRLFGGWSRWVDVVNSNPFMDIFRPQVGRKITKPV